MAANLRDTVSRELGLTVSVGISLTKTLAKLCSKFRKPNGQTIVRREHVPLLLARIPIDKVWGIGPASTARLRVRGVYTAAALAAWRLPTCCACCTSLATTPERARFTRDRASTPRAAYPPTAS